MDFFWVFFAFFFLGFFLRFFLFFGDFCRYKKENGMRRYSIPPKDPRFQPYKDQRWGQKIFRKGFRLNQRFFFGARYGAPVLERLIFHEKIPTGQGFWTSFSTTTTTVVVVVVWDVNIHTHSGGSGGVLVVWLSTTTTTTTVVVVVVVRFPPPPYSHS